MRRWGATAFILGASTLTACTAERFDEPVCRASNHPLPDQQGSVFAHGYFPTEFGRPNQTCGYPVIGDIEREWYPRQWRAAYEPSLHALERCEALPEFALRFSYIPSFHPSVFIRVQSDSDGLSLIAKELTGAGGYDPGSLGRSKKIRLTDRQAFELKSMLESGALFGEQPDTCERGFDGSEWIFEMVDKNGYKMVKRWSPDEGAGYDLGRYLIELSGWDIETY